MADYIVNLNGHVDVFLQSEALYQIANMPANTTTIRCNVVSPGGDYMAALSVYNALRETRKRVITAAQGFVASAGAVILLAGDEIQAAENAVIMFHMPMYAGPPLNADEMEKKIENLKVVEESLITALCGKTGKDKENVRNFLKDEVWMTPDKAKEMGIIDKILPFKRRKVNIQDVENVPAEISNFVKTNNKEVDTMTLRELCNSLSLEVKEEDNDEQITNVVVEFVGGLNDKITNLEEKLTEKKEPKSEPKPNTVKLPDGIVRMVKRSRESEIRALAEAGQITNAVSKDMIATWCSDDTIQNALDDEGNTVDNFDATIDALKKNEKVVNFGGQNSGVHVLPKGEGDNTEATALIRNAEARTQK